MLGRSHANGSTLIMLEPSVQTLLSPQQRLPKAAVEEKISLLVTGDVTAHHVPTAGTMSAMGRSVARA